ncbi:MAG TPA: hypothetical protein VKU60_12190 [Chloroflexota bacterium]|nr:hypothetical protein [Chloroflexota bacterium]
MAASLRIVVPDTPFSRALVDGSVAVDGFDVAFEYPDTSSPAASARLRGALEPDIAGGEQVIPDYILRLARGVGQPLTALPVFLTRGMVHSKYVGRRGGPAADQLDGGRIGMSRMLAASAVYLRGMLAGAYGLCRDRVTWLAGEPLSSDDSLGSDWPLLDRRLGASAPELLQLLSKGELDAVLYPGGGGGNLYHWVEPSQVSTSTSHYGDLESLVRQQANLELPIASPGTVQAWFKQTGVYPLFHMIALHREVAEAHVGLTSALVRAFDQAAERAPSYMSATDRRAYDRERDLLGVDPNRPGLTALNRRSIDALLDTLEADAVLPRRPSIEEMFSG